MENQSEKRHFDMGSLRNNLPQKRGLSMYYSGKSQSFACILDVRNVEDLKKQEHPNAKKRKKYPKTKEMHHHQHQYMPYPCQRVSSKAHCNSPYIGI
ncbi:hypothetical protein ERO13_A01G004200v2 [Gossypium hirsutum]|uniref:Uncharacterized protein n=4 Tax=Gossypium TaxID=3633 RepID=A0A5J5WUK0_GOSBA|nr:hypothetical protein ES319_A01G003600v1 [Gossypium barbadense]KAG4212726.1 hypothetical protein ERO13_A01G004200v2 [Gossypium hirsutum]TYH29373.1 hypothetical protein ES288_A01G006000v1 [Gossypium darwinii]TYI41234.1 hypothetical protein ES332_A01G005500v1 [Gossypium tomentosum]TYJ47642.1 hypothetical protein E1A91_A01G004700v1 [Gossypium mustelinum]